MANLLDQTSLYKGKVMQGYMIALNATADQPVFIGP